MRFRPPHSEEPELNLVPLIDVLLMTLIFLVVTTSFSKEAHLRITLPQATVQKTVKGTALRIAIDAQGRYYVNDRQLLKNTPEVVENAMLLAADGKTPHEAVVRVMDAARRLGYTHLTFATQQPVSGSPAQ
jgi:biopolymer transport protein ExbD